MTSSVLSDGNDIDAKYSCDGADVSPPLAWSGLPSDTKSIAVVCDDPDAPGGLFTHWLLYDLPASTTALREGSNGGGKEGVNSFKRIGYGGPCPPRGAPHRYVFHVYALDVPSIGDAGMSGDKVRSAIVSHTIAEGRILGRYQRRH